MMNGRGKSDSAIVAGKPTNKAGQPAAESVEPSAEAEGNASQQSTRRAQDRGSVSQALERIRQVARQRKRFTSLFHHISVELLRVAFFALKRDAAPGVDGLIWQDYEADLDRKIEDLHARVHRGAYRALPSRRHYIPKADGQQRPLAIAALEDKIVQKAACAVLNVIYEEDFLGFSYGFRPKRSQHDALDALITGTPSGAPPAFKSLCFGWRGARSLGFPTGWPNAQAVVQKRASCQLSDLLVLFRRT